MSGYISWEEDAAEEGDKLIFRGDRTDVCYGVAAILLGACKYTGLTLEQLIEVVYTAMKNSDAEDIKLYKAGEIKSENHYVHCEELEDGSWDVTGRADAVSAIAAIASAVLTISENTGFESSALLENIAKACKLEDKTVVRFDDDGCMVLNGSAEKVMAGITILIRRACKKANLTVEEAMTIMYMGLKMTEEDSAPADGSDAERKEGIT